MSTDTPRTDAAETKLSHDADYIDAVDADFARELERENRALRDALTVLLKFHPESPETGAELPMECWTEDYRKAVTTANKLLSTP